MAELGTHGVGSAVSLGLSGGTKQWEAPQGKKRLEILHVSRCGGFSVGPTNFFLLHSADPSNAWLNCRAISITVIYMNYLPIIFNYQAA